MANLTLVQAINLALIQEMEKDDRVLLLGEDIGLNGGVFRVTEGLHQRFGGDRVVDSPLAESGIVGTAIGLAVGGMCASVATAQSTEVAALIAELQALTQTVQAQAAQIAALQTAVVTAAPVSESSTNTVIGQNAFTSNTTGKNNTASESRALLSNTTGTNNTATVSQ